MELIFPEESEDLPFAKLGQELEYWHTKNIWIFPDIEKVLPSLYNKNGEFIIEPYKYYVTSGEAVRKSEVLISDIKELTRNIDDNNILDNITDLLIKASEFYELLLEIRGDSVYLEITKCEDGIYNGNICACKNPKKKKSNQT
jgi:hypothetical protein